MDDRQPAIDLILITGAGASREFGISGKKVPLMQDWATHLHSRLAMHSSVYVAMTELSPDVDGFAFETQLGRYLAARNAFSLVKNITAASKDLQYSNWGFLNSEGVLEGWHQVVEDQLTEIDNIIRSTLYELYKPAELDVHRAAGAYQQLLEAFGVRPGGNKQLVYATTNYDPLGEAALEELGFQVEWGEHVQARPGGEPPVKVEGLIDGIGQSVPVLHLHGRINWFRRPETGQAYAAPVEQYNPGLGSPLAILPDPAKVYSDEIISSLWRQFESALERAACVLVLGHSLNDDTLVDVLKTKVQPLARLAVTFHMDDATRNNPSAFGKRVAEHATWLDKKFPGARSVPTRFGDDDDPAPPTLIEWVKTLEENHLLGAF